MRITRNYCLYVFQSVAQERLIKRANIKNMEIMNKIIYSVERKLGRHSRYNKYM